MRKMLAVCLAAFSLVLVPQESHAQSCPGASPWVFDDVPASDPFCSVITEMAVRGVALGCAIIDANHRLFCPNSPTTRNQMAAYLSRLVTSLSTPTLVVTQGPDRFERWVGSTGPTTLLKAGYLLGVSGDGLIIMSLASPPSPVGGTQYQLSAVEWCMQSVSNGAFVTAAAVYHDQPGAPGYPLSTAVVDQTDRTSPGCYTLAVPAFSPRDYAFLLSLAGQTTNLTSAGIVLQSIKTTWVPATGADGGATAEPAAPVSALESMQDLRIRLGR
ncbi:MAG: hypothetical protein U1F41_00855 [Burkholderiales bacterium]